MKLANDRNKRFDTRFLIDDALLPESFPSSIPSSVAASDSSGTLGKPWEVASVISVDRRYQSKPRDNRLRL